MIFPYNTDAPIYYRPIATIALILLNTLVFAFQVANPDACEPFLLRLGDGIHPVQWLSSIFMHADPIHLIGNMVFLWSFGLVVEGKIGPWKTLLIYFGIGIFESALGQFIMLYAEPSFALGASAAIFGFMGLCLIWAPMNCMECFFLFGVRVFFFETSILVMVGLYIALQILAVFLTAGHYSGEFAHLSGAIFGIIIGIVMVKAQMVDCEYWDIFSVWAGQHHMTPEERRKFEDSKPEVKKRLEEEHQKQRTLLELEIDRALRAKHVVPTLRLCERMKKNFPDWQLDENKLLLLIQLLGDPGHQEDAITAMKEYLARFQAKSDLVRLKLAKLYLESENNRGALKILNEVDQARLDLRQGELFRKLCKFARRNNESDTYALTDGDS